MSKLCSDPIIDTHHHLWDLGLDKHPWLSETADERGGLGDLGPLRSDYPPPTFRPTSSGRCFLAMRGAFTGWATKFHRRRDSRPDRRRSPRINDPKRMLRQPGEALTTVIKAVIVTSSAEPGIDPA